MASSIFCMQLWSSSRTVVGVTQDPDLEPGVLELFDVCCRLTWITPADDGVAAAGTAGGLVLAATRPTNTNGSQTSSERPGES